jgi:hypothetical protein
VKQAIADKIIALAKGGECNSDVLYERALKDIRRSIWPARERVDGWSLRRK